MFPVGFFALAFGMFLVDCAVTNRAPITLLEAIIANPGNLRDVLLQSRGTGYASDVPSAGASGSDALPGLMNPNGVLGGSATGAAAVAWAKAQIGKPYKWGATGPNAFDCSGLVQQAYAHAGVNLPRTTYGMITVGSRVSKADLQIGDLVFPDPGHVQLYAGNGTVVESPHTGLNVRQVKMWGFMTARRVVHDTVQNSSPDTGAARDKVSSSYGGLPGAQDIFGGTQ